MGFIARVLIPVCAVFCVLVATGWFFLGLLKEAGLC